MKANGFCLNRDLRFCVRELGKGGGRLMAAQSLKGAKLQTLGMPGGATYAPTDLDILEEIKHSSTTRPCPHVREIGKKKHEIHPAQVQE